MSPRTFAQIPCWRLVTEGQSALPTWPPQLRANPLCNRHGARVFETRSTRKDDFLGPFRATPSELVEFVAANRP
jgi:hypothetical protein